MQLPARTTTIRALCWAFPKSDLTRFSFHASRSIVLLMRYEYLAGGKEEGNRPGKSISHISHERSPFQINAIKVRIPATTPNVIVRKPEKCRNPVVTEKNRTTNKISSPTDHRPSFVWGFSVK